MDKTVVLHLPQMLSQHLLADADEPATQLRESKHLVRVKLPKDQTFPFAADDVHRRIDAADVWPTTWTRRRCSGHVSPTTYQLVGTPEKSRNFSEYIAQPRLELRPRTP